MRGRQINVIIISSKQPLAKLRLSIVEIQNFRCYLYVPNLKFLIIEWQNEDFKKLLNSVNTLQQQKSQISLRFRGSY